METLRERLVRTFRWTEDGETTISDLSAWWRDPDVLSALGGELAGLHPDASPTAVLTIEATGFIPASLTARHLGVGLAVICKDTHPSEVAERLHRRTLVGDYNDRDMSLSMRPTLLSAQDRVLFVDDWIETGAHALAAQDLIGDTGATWLGVAAVVDAAESATRRRLAVRSLIRVTELRW